LNIHLCIILIYIQQGDILESICIEKECYVHIFFPEMIFSIIELTSNKENYILNVSYIITDKEKNKNKT